MDDKYLNKFKPVQIIVRNPEDFERSVKMFKSMVQKERIIAEINERKQYEKPSVKKRRKKREAEQKRLSYEYKMRLIASGEWEKRQQKKKEKRDQNG